MKTDDLVQLSTYDKRESKNADHGLEYQELLKAGEEGRITLIQDKRSRRLYVSKSQADELVAVLRRSHATGASPAVDQLDRRLDGIESSVSEVLELVRRIVSDLGCK